MAYSTHAELTALTGTSLLAASQDAIIAQADREINAKLYAAGLTPPSSDDILKAASLNLAHVGVITQNRMINEEARHPTEVRLRVDDGQNKQIEELIAKAWSDVAAYITYTASSSPLPTIAVVGRAGQRIGEHSDMSTTEEDAY